MPVDQSIALMARETRVVYGEVPELLGEGELPEQSWRIRGDRFLLRAEGRHLFYYAKSQGITVERGAGADPGEEGLWLNGTVYSAIAAINGLVPVHASAVACDGKVYAFTGASGAGKSTIVAALTRLGMPMFCDDTLVLDLSDPSQIMCLPGHKRLKLTPEALALTGATCEEKVARTLEKFYARPAGGVETRALPLAGLVFLEEAAELSFEPVRGGAALARLQDDHYSTALLAFARNFDRPALFGHLATLARLTRLAVFARPRDSSLFDVSAQFVADKIAGWPQTDGV